MQKILLIGTGAISATHIEALNALKDRAELYALADAVPGKAQETAEKYGLNVKTGDYRELIKDPEITIAAVCTPPGTHCEIAETCLNAGKHVLIEKPMAPSLEECDRINRAAKRNGKLVSVVAQSRFDNEARAAKMLLEKFPLGRLLYSEADSVWWRDNCYYHPAWRGLWETEGGGCTLNHAVHHIDLLLWYSGRVESVTALMGNLNHTNSEEEDISMALVRFENGAFGRVTATLLHHGKKQRMVLETEKAEITLPFGFCSARALGNGFPQKDQETEEEIRAFLEKLEKLPFTGHTGQWANMVAAAEGKELLVSDGEAGRSAVELIMGIYQSAAEGREIRFPLTEADSFYSKRGILDNAPRFHRKPDGLSPIEAGPMILANKRYE